jgi:hypothetical protein
MGRQREERIAAPTRAPKPSSDVAVVSTTPSETIETPMAGSSFQVDADRGHAFGAMAVLTERDAVRDMANASGGSPLEASMRKSIEPVLDTDLSGVRLHRDTRAASLTAAVNAPAVTLGRKIFLGNGAANNHDVLAHELTHVVQQDSSVPASPESLSLGRRDDAAETEAASAAEGLATGAPVTLTGGQSNAIARRFGAGKYGHGGIETEAATGGTELAPDDPRKKGTSEMYSGNFMRDMNQLNVPKVIDGLSGLPKDLSNPKQGGMIGTKGAHDITTAVIQALAILELGPEVAKSLVTGGTPATKGGAPTADNIGAYRPEEHIDNPMGTGAKDIVVTNTAPGQKDSHGTKIEVGEPRVANPVVGDQTCPVDKDRDAQLQGAAGKGLQVENPDLYKVSAAGLGNHIYNSVEATKKRWLKAAKLGPTAIGRSEYGAGSHAVEDYFSHSNFVEVSLNSYIASALANKGKPGQNEVATKFAETVAARNKEATGAEQTKQGYYVDTLYDSTVPADPKKPAGPKKQAVTTGTFGGDDTMVSIAHILLPQMPKLQKAMLQAVDMGFGIIADKSGPTGWAQLKAELSTEPAGAAGTTVLEGFATAGMVAPVPDIKLKWASVPITPGLVGAPVTVSLPTGIDHLTSSMPVTDAVAEYGAIYHRIKEMVDLVQQYAEYAKLLGMPLEPLIKEIKLAQQEIEQAIKKAIKAQVVAGLVAIVDQLSGRKAEEKAKAKAERGPAADPSNPDEEFEKDMGDALNYFHESVEKIEERTSIESRLKNGDLSQMPKTQVEALVGPVEEVSGPETKDGKPVLDKDGKQVMRKYYVSKKPLPPSHSEISKDHEPYSDHPNGDVKSHHDSKADPGHEQGSPFFGLARSLAVEAVKHADAQLQVVWASQSQAGDTSLLGDGVQYKYTSASDPKSSDKIHDNVLAEADKRAAAEKERSAKEGTSFLTRDATGDDAETMKKPGVARLLNLVDEFIAHPDDTGWWRPVTDAYIAHDADAVYESILRRNQSRKDRNLANEGKK